MMRQTSTIHNNQLINHEIKRCYQKVSVLKLQACIYIYPVDLHADSSCRMQCFSYSCSRTPATALCVWYMVYGIWYMNAKCSADKSKGLGRIHSNAEEFRDISLPRPVTTMCFNTTLAYSTAPSTEYRVQNTEYRVRSTVYGVRSTASHCVYTSIYMKTGARRPRIHWRV